MELLLTYINALPFVIAMDVVFDQTSSEFHGFFKLVGKAAYIYED